MIKLQSVFQVSERRACRVVQQSRCTQRYVPTIRADEDALTQAIVALAQEYGRYGYRRITALLKNQGCNVIWVTLLLGTYQLSLLV